MKGYDICFWYGYRLLFLSERVFFFFIGFLGEGFGGASGKVFNFDIKI